MKKLKLFIENHVKNVIREFEQDNDNQTTIPFQGQKSLKAQQLEIVLRENPMQDDHHTGIRTIEDIKTFDEVSQGEGLITTPDFTEQDILKAQQTGEITIYSSHPIKNGVFVTPSKMEVETYAGGETIYSKKVKLHEVAWIDSIEGQYANVQAQNS